MGQITSFEDLDVWRVGREIRRDLYGLATNFPKHEQYGLGHQIRTAAVSLTANIAEGYGRFHFKENIQFCRIARGSAYELLDHLIACKDQGYVDAEQYKGFRSKLLRFIQLVNGYIRSIGQTGNKRGPDFVTNDD